MRDDLIWGVVLAAAGGAAGGAVGGHLKKVADGAIAKDDWLIDTGKDVAKCAVRSADKLRGGSTAPSTSGDSTAPSSTNPADPAKTSGDRKPTGKDPLEFLTGLSADLAQEGVKAKDILQGMVRDARDANSKADFEDDPVAVAGRGADFGKLTSELKLESRFYLRELWHTWLAEYAYKSEYGALADKYTAEDKVSGKLRDKLAKAAVACEENVDDWIREYGGKAQAKATKQAEADNRPTAARTPGANPLTPSGSGSGWR